jgi:uncharacterized protein (UPF0303 family)
VNDTDAAQLAALLADESRLVFSTFDHATAWALGSWLRDRARTAQLPVAISIRRNGQCLFHAALPGSSADNDAWLLRKAAVVERYGHSSYYVGCKFRANGGDFDTDSRLDLAVFAAHGGAFPIILRVAWVRVRMAPGSRVSAAPTRMLSSGATCSTPTSSARWAIMVTLLKDARPARALSSVAGNSPSVRARCTR